MIGDLEQKLQGHIQPTDTLPEIRHTFSHFHLTMHPIIAHISNTPNQVMAGDQQDWYQPQQLSGIGLAAPIKTLLNRL